MPRVGLDHQRVLAGALELANQEGLNTLTLGRLAKHLNVKPPSLYNHVAGLEGLRRDLSLQGFEVLGQVLQAATVAKTGGAALRAAAYAYRDFAKTQPSLFEATIRTVEDEDEPLREAGHAALKTLQAVFASLGLDGDEAVHAIRSYQAALTGFLLLELGRGFGMPQDVDKSFDYLLSNFIAVTKDITKGK